VKKLHLPCDKSEIETIKCGDIVSLNGIIATGRDAFHKHVTDTYIKNKTEDDTLKKLKKVLKNTFLYHCGPIIRKKNNSYEFLAGGPTTSIREEPYEDKVLSLFNLHGVIGKGGMGNKTKASLIKNKALYLHATGGAASLIGSKVLNVIDVMFLKEFGVPEALWVLEVKDFLCTVTMDYKGLSVHEKVRRESRINLEGIIAEL
jgi:fumarate hydratase class I